MTLREFYKSSLEVMSDFVINDSQKPLTTSKLLKLGDRKVVEWCIIPDSLRMTGYFIQVNLEMEE